MCGCVCVDASVIPSPSIAVSFFHLIFLFDQKLCKTVDVYCRINFCLHRLNLLFAKVFYRLNCENGKELKSIRKIIYTVWMYVCVYIHNHGKLDIDILG